MDYPLDKFKSWLLTKDRKIATAHQYASLVRKALRACGGVPRALVDLEAVEAEMPATERVMFRTAWRNFVDFAKEGNTAVPPTLPDRRNTAPGPLPALAYLLRDLAQAIPVHVIPELRWGNVRATGGDEAEVFHPNGSYVWRVKLDLMQKIKDEVKPESGVHALIPNVGGSPTPMPLPRLRKLIERAQMAKGNAEVTG